MRVTTVIVRRTCPKCKKTITTVTWPEYGFMGDKKIIKGSVAMKEPCSECMASDVFGKEEDQE